jgi:hypothetical protein
LSPFQKENRNTAVGTGKVPIGYQEAVRDEGFLCVMRRPDGGHVVFTAESVFRFLDLPTTAAK